MIRTLLILFSFLQLNPAFAQVNSCDCPAKDELANPKCGPAPAALRKRPDARDVEKSVSCPTCDIFNPISPVAPWWPEVRETKAVPVPSPAEEAIPDLLNKDKVELNSYLNCYRQNTKKEKRQFCHFKDTLTPLIELAAKSAHQPFAVQACLFKKESEFLPTAGSPVGARGYIQFMNDTVIDTNESLHFTAKELKTQLGDVDIRIEKLKRNGKFKLANVLKHEQRKRYADYRARLVWDEYWKGTANPPKKLPANTVSCAYVAFVASLMKQTFDLFLILSPDYKKLSDSELPRIGNMDSREAGVWLAGAYNMGRTGFGRRCGNVKTLSDCVENMDVGETRQHIISIDRCSEKGNMKKFYPREDHSCKESQCTN